jgi:hypothetical protein
MTMASIISGYESDIFISYRQKDNKHDRSVTEFVDKVWTKRLVIRLYVGR